MDGAPLICSSGMRSYYYHGMVPTLLFSFEKTYYSLHGEEYNTYGAFHPQFETDVPATT